MKKKKIFVDQDNVIANFSKAANKAIEIYPEQIYPQSQFGFFLNLEEMEDAIQAITVLEEYFEVHILTRPSIYNLNCYSEKALWILNRYGRETLERTIMACDKSMFKGAYLIDDNGDDGQPDFDGEWIQFGSNEYPNWKMVLKYIFKKEFQMDIDV